MSKKLAIQTSLLEHKRGETTAMRWLKFDLLVNADIPASRATILSVLTEMLDAGTAQKWGGGRSTRWHINREQPLG